MKRFVAKIDFYVYADSEEEAIKQSEKIAMEMDLKKDNKAKLIELHSLPFGSLKATKIELK